MAVRDLLAGTLVVSIEQAVAAPYCTSRLADAGAEVIKVERVEGDFARDYDQVVHGESAYFVWLNRGKKSVVLDLKSALDKACVLRMIEEADVFVQNLSPGAAARLGLDSAVLRERFPRLVTCDISGYGEVGRYASMKAYDLIVQCESGLASITGSPEGAGRVGVSVCDIACGMHAHAAILEALLERARTGRGSALKVSLFAAMADWMTVPLLHHDYGGVAPERVGLKHPSIAPYGAYRTADGRQIIVAVQNEREWQRLCEHVLGQPELATDPRFAGNTRRCTHRAELDSIISEVFASSSSEELGARLLAARVAFGAVNSVADFSAHPQLRRVTIGSSTGNVDLVAPPVSVDGESVELGPVPALGEHTDEIRRRFGARES
ncbi:MAG TPA: CaiB/BaiF CoA-transferase family protein [Gammaproteobacteria bacterium]|nr:CaiB/BaiF CoA-transferase family protein [Gammaproteobacteria bacterium]